MTSKPMNVLLVVVGGALGGGFGLAGAWVGAQAILRSVRISEQRALLTEARARLVALTVPVLEFVAAMESIVLDQAVLWGDDTVEKKQERHQRLLDARQLEMGKMAARLALEPGTEESEGDLREIWLSFSRHMMKLRLTPTAPYLGDAQRAAVEEIQSTARKVEGDLKARVADLDRRAEAVVGLQGRPGST
jgi:hypothetical protein